MTLSPGESRRLIKNADLVSVIFLRLIESIIRVCCLNLIVWKASWADRIGKNEDK